MATPFDDLVTCLVCFEIHVDPKRLPVCEHVFCASCLEKMVAEGVIVCPKCNSRNTVPAGDVTKLKTDLSIKAMIESFRCIDCENVEQQSKQCTHCRVVVCSTCAVIHDSKEKCGLLSSIRSLSLKVPTSEEIQTIEQLQVEWTLFKEKNAEQKWLTASWIDRLIILLQEKKSAVLSTYDKYDTFARERLQWLEDAKEIEKIVQDLQKFTSEKKIETVEQAQRSAERRNEFFSKKKQILSELVPYHLGVVYIRDIKQKIAALGHQICSRQPGEEKDVQIKSWNTKGEVWQRHPRNDFFEKKLADGRVQLVRDRGENCTLRVVDENDVVKWKSETWNNRDDGPSLLRNSHHNMLWGLRKGNDLTLYSTLFPDLETKELFEEAMMNTIVRPWGREDVV